MKPDSLKGRAAVRFDLAGPVWLSYSCRRVLLLAVAQLFLECVGAGSTEKSGWGESFLVLEKGRIQLSLLYVTVERSVPRLVFVLGTAGSCTCGCTCRYFSTFYVTSLKSPALHRKDVVKYSCVRPQSWPLVFFSKRWQIWHTKINSNQLCGVLIGRSSVPEDPSWFLLSMALTPKYPKIVR